MILQIRVVGEKLVNMPSEVAVKQTCARLGDSIDAPANVLRVSCATYLDRNGCRAKIYFQNSSDLARREAASTASACWATAFLSFLMRGIACDLLPASRGLENPLVSRFDEPARIVLIRPVLVTIIWNRRSTEVVKRRGYFHDRKISRDKVVEQEELHIATKVAKEIEEAGISHENVA